MIREKFVSIRALFETYDQEDCWCGEDVVGVFERYVGFCSDPMDGLLADPAQSEEVRAMLAERFGNGRYPTLKAMSILTPAERRDGLLRDVRALLAAELDDAARRAELIQLGGESLLDFTDFWSANADEVEESGRASAFLERAWSVLDSMNLSRFPG